MRKICAGESNEQDRVAIDTIVRRIETARQHAAGGLEYRERRLHAWLLSLMNSRKNAQAFARHDC